MSLAERFFALHDRSKTFVLPNCWDAASARLFEEAGFPAVATSSSAMAWALGYADGERVDVDELFAAIARVTRVVRIPVSADLEAGFGETPQAVAHTVERAIAAGAVGANLEDYDPRRNEAIAIEAHCERIRAVKARAAALGVRFFVNGRSDLLLYGLGDAATRVERTIERLRAYAAAGADGVFAPGVSDAPTIATLAAALDAPLNVLAGATTPPVAELRRLGVARVSVGGGPMRRVLGLVRDIASELHDRGTFAFAAGPGVSYDDANALFAKS